MVKKPWFGHRNYFGFGWGAPQTWQGWTVFAIYLSFVVYQAFSLEIVMKISPNAALYDYLVQIFLASIALITISWITSGKPQWSGRTSKK
jgi:hypothetical protein